jgi:hypothetical protein
MRIVITNEAMVFTQQPPTRAAERSIMEEGINCTQKVMVTCIYGGKKAGACPYCDYLDMVGHSRGCPPNACTRYIKKTRTRKRKMAAVVPVQQGE